MPNPSSELAESPKYREFFGTVSSNITQDAEPAASDDDDGNNVEPQVAKSPSPKPKTKTTVGVKSPKRKTTISKTKVVEVAANGAVVTETSPGKRKLRNNVEAPQGRTNKRAKAT